QHVRRADGHHVDVGIGEHVTVVGTGPGVPEDLAGVVRPVGGGVGRVHQPGPDLQFRVDLRDRLVGAAVQLAHPAHADQADTGPCVSVVGDAHGGGTYLLGFGFDGGAGLAELGGHGGGQQ